MFFSVGFARFVKDRSFSTYVDYVIAPSFELHRDIGLLKYTLSGEKLENEMPFRNFLSARMLWDEAMAARAYSWTTANPSGLLIGLVGAGKIYPHAGLLGGAPGNSQFRLLLH